MHRPRTAAARDSTPAVQPAGKKPMTVSAQPRHTSTERDEWLTVDEVCAELKISRRTFDRWRALGTGPRAKRLGGSGPVRVRRSWLDQWLDAPDQDIA
jgi:excisionase family DNA binding protein